MQGRLMLDRSWTFLETYADVRAVCDQLRDSLEASLRPNKDIPL